MYRCIYYYLAIGNENDGEETEMTAIYEIPFEGGGSKQFTLCCGASDKGCDGYIGCRACYAEIEDYLGFGDEGLCRAAIQDSDILERFENFLNQPKHNTIEEYFDWLDGTINSN